MTRLYENANLIKEIHEHQHLYMPSFLLTFYVCLIIVGQQTEHS